MTRAISITVALALLGLFFFVVGIVAHRWPKKIQGYVLNFHANAKGLAKWNPLLKWVQTSSYVVSLRIIGALAIVVALVALYVLIKQ